MVSKKLRSIPTPALWTKISIFPHLFITFSTILFASVGFCTSTFIAKDFVLFINLTLSRALFSFRSAITTFAPNSYNCLATAKPIPLAPPVIRATWPPKSNPANGFLSTESKKFSYI